MTAAADGSAARAVSARFRSWPITEVKALEPALQKMGLRVPAAEIDGTAPGRAAGDCLSDALCSVGPAGRGGTGSFISADGLIITNHHVALDAVRQASTAENDYVANGFVARTREEEIAGPDYEVWITRACEDVSEEILKVLRSERDALKRANKVRDARQELARARESDAKAKAGGAKAAGLRCEVQEMWADKTYVLFTYDRLQDVRIVYVPPFALGCFGGDTDNFEWPRHTADFTLLRAYVAPDSSAAEPSPDNVPYKPTKCLRASPNGVRETDFVFLLGFPGHTMRYAPTCRLAYSDSVAVPNLVKDFGQKLELIRKHSAADRTAALKLTSAKKGLANEHKRSTGKVVIMRRLGLIEEREAEEAKLCAVAPEAAPLLGRLCEVYDTLRKGSTRSHTLDALQGIYHGSTLLAVSHALHEGRLEAAKPDAERESAYRSRNLPFLVKRLTKRLKDLVLPNEAALLRRVATMALADDGLRAAAPSLSKLDVLASALEDAAAATTAADEVGADVTCLPSLSTPQLEALLGISEGDDNAAVASRVASEACYEVASQVYAAYVADRDATKALLSERDELLAKLSDLQQAASDEVFYPDANGCLRLSAGHVEGYEAADAVVHKPVTTLGGLLEKHVEATLLGGDNSDDFECPPRLAALCKADAVVRKTPVCVLYSTDTVGGNSGSPVLDADGNFVAINFDRQRLGLMNEFKWSHEYSRSIGTDVRYILWLVGTYDNAPTLVEEMTGGAADASGEPAK